MKVVFDAGVVFSSAGWRGEAHRCLLAMAHRRLVAYATEETLKELSKLLADRGTGRRIRQPPHCPGTRTMLRALNPGRWANNGAAM